MVGVVISHSANVPSRKESIAALICPTVVSHTETFSHTKPPAAHCTLLGTLPRLYSLTIALNPPTTAVHSLLSLSFPPRRIKNPPELVAQLTAGRPWAHFASRAFTSSTCAVQLSPSCKMSSLSHATWCAINMVCTSVRSPHKISIPCV